MEDPTAKIITQTVADLTATAARNTVGAVADKVNAAKKKRDQARTIAELESLINELVNDKLELERIAKTFENELVSQQISDDDISFIVNSAVPLVRDLTKHDAKQQEYIGYIEKLLSKESLKVMQLIGFNYRDAIGRPLTDLCAGAIRKLSSSSDQNESAVASLQNQTALAQLSTDADAYNRFVKLLGREDLVIKNKGSTND